MGKRIRILIVNFHPLEYPGGVEKVVNSIREILIKSGYDVDVLTAKEFNSVEKFLQKFFRYIKMDEILINYFLSRHFKRIKNRYELIITQAFWGLFINHKKAINIYHGTSIGTLKILKNYLSILSKIKLQVIGYYEKISGKRKHIVAVSKKCANEVKRYYKLKNVTILENFVDTAEFRPVSDEKKKRLREKFSLPQKKSIILYTGLMGFRKGTDILNEIILKCPDYHFLICTSRIDKQFKLKLNNVTYMERLNYSNMKNIYQLSDLFLFPTRYEGFELVTLEAMSSGLPVIGSNAGVLNEVQKKSPTLSKFVFDIEVSTDKYINAIRLILKRKKYYSKLSRQYIMENNSSAIYKKKWVNYIDRIINEE